LCVAESVSAGEARVEIQCKVEEYSDYDAAFVERNLIAALNAPDDHADGVPLRLVISPDIAKHADSDSGEWVVVLLDPASNVVVPKSSMRRANGNQWLTAKVALISAAWVKSAETQPSAKRVEMFSVLLRQNHAEQSSSRWMIAAVALAGLIGMLGLLFIPTVRRLLRNIKLLAVSG
ncbi:MAG: hypothetical protein KDB32_13525, partial [Planctomycetes bacterium]|nr:hypothetical protein [Planctomycetota bacterium]